MATRIKDWQIPYTGGIGIEITENHVINVLLRRLNNLIHVNDDNELYVDLQLPDGILPDDDFPVGVTTWKILQEDGWLQSGIILNWKTTSWDYVRLIFANDQKLYYDPGTWVWIEIWAGWGGIQINVATATQLWLIKLGSNTKLNNTPEAPSSVQGRTYPIQLNDDNQAVINIPWTDTTYTAGNNITIDQNNQISCTLPPALIYRGNVTSQADLPSSGQQVWDTYFVIGEDALYSWDGTQWNYVWWVGVDLSNLFNKLIDDSDDIVEWSNHLFVTPAEKTRWNNKQDPISAWHGINFTNNVVTNILPFEPGNTGSMGQFLKKTNDGYVWADIPWGGWGWGWWWGTSYTAWYGIQIQNREISNTKAFDPINNGRTGQILKKTANGYIWADEWWGWGWDWDSKIFDVDDIASAQEAIDYLLSGKLAILRVHRIVWYTPKEWDYLFYPVIDSTSTSSRFIFHTIPTSNDVYIQWDWSIRHKYPTVEILTNDGEVTTVSTDGYTEADREDTWREKNMTASEYSQITPEQWVIYNIFPNS